MMRTDGTPGCGGAPTCPSPLVARAEDCFTQDALVEHDDLAARSALLGAKYLSWDIGYAYGIHESSITSNNLYVGLAYHFPALPLRLAGGFYYGAFKHPNAPCSVGCSARESLYDASGTYAAYFLGAYFAPFSSPNYVKFPLSYFNPYLGLELRGDTFKQTETSYQSPSGSAFAALSVGNVMFIGPLSFTYSYSLGLGGNQDSKLKSMFVLALGIVTAHSPLM